MKRVVVVGGGVTGLSCAHELVKRGVVPTVYEARLRLGGNILTDRVDGYVIDAGPDAWVATKPDATVLAKELGLEAELIATIPENRRVYIAWEGKLHPMPEGLVLGIPTELAPFVKTPLLSVEGKIRAGFDLFIPPRIFHGSEDESVGDFIARRLGPEVADRLVGPLLGGIFAGDAYAISVRAAFAQLVDAEAKYGSLIAAMRAARRAGGPATRPAPSAFVSLRGGMGALIEALVAAVDKSGSVRAGSGVRLVTPTPSGPGRFAIELESGAIEHGDDVVLALPTRISARVAASMNEVAGALEGLMGYASSMAVFLAYPRAAVAHPLDATGFIAPREARDPDASLMAGTFVTSKWEARAPEGMVLFRVFLGGPNAARLLEREDAELARIAAAELTRFVPLSGEPVLTRVYRHERASPQPTVGHVARRAKLAAAVSRVPGLYVAASGVDGVGIPDCVKQAKAIADAIASRAP